MVAPLGIYGYSFAESGRRVFELFKARGLTAVINDNLIQRVLFLGSLMVRPTTTHTRISTTWAPSPTDLSPSFWH
jgi:hypothetical protein